MRVQEVLTGDGQRRYLVLGDDGSPILPAMLFLKYLDRIGRARNTLHSYAYNLLLFFEFLQHAALGQFVNGVDLIAQVAAQPAQFPDNQRCGDEGPSEGLAS